MAAFFMLFSQKSQLSLKSHIQVTKKSHFCDSNVTFLPVPLHRLSGLTNYPSRLAML